MIAIDLGMFWIFKRVCRFVQEWTGITSFALARACSVSCVLCSMALLFLVLFGQMETLSRIMFLFSAFAGQAGGLWSLSVVRYMERLRSIHAENALQNNFFYTVVRLWAVLCACSLSFSVSRDVPLPNVRTREAVMCGDINAIMIWIAVLFVYFVSINPDPLGPSRIDRAIRKLFPQSA